MLGRGVEVQPVALVRQILERNDPEKRELPREVAERVVHDPHPPLDLRRVKFRKLPGDKRHPVAKGEIATKAGGRAAAASLNFS